MRKVRTENKEVFHILSERNQIQIEKSVKQKSFDRKIRKFFLSFCGEPNNKDRENWEIENIWQKNQEVVPILYDKNHQSLLIENRGKSLDKDIRI